MIDLHTHSTFSDGELIPAELVRRAEAAGYSAVAVTDHADFSNLYLILENLLRFKREAAAHYETDLVVGVELTHLPPGLISKAVDEARKNGAELVVVHGETIVEPVARGTNLAALEAGADILAHPGLITPEEARLAAANNVYLEVTTRKGHSLTNGRVVSLAREFKAGLVVNNDAHAPGDLVSRDMRERVALGAGLSRDEFLAAEANSRGLLDRIFARASRPG